MLQIDAFHTLEVREEKPFGVLLGDDSIVLPRRHVPEGCKVGDELTVFVYQNADGSTVATSKKPKGKVGEFACLRCIDTMQHGAFLDWGLEKDLFVPNDEQPLRMRVDRHYVVAITTDTQNRVMGSGRVREFLDDDMSALYIGKAVELIVYEHHELGLKVIVDHRWEGMIYKSDLFEKLRIGSKLSGAVTKVRDDARVDVRIRSVGRKGRDEGQEQLLTALRGAEGYLALHDKSSPEEVKEGVQMSKKAFKRAIGNLLRARIIRLEEGGIRLVADPDAELAES